jgi:hypothetical protein
MCVKANIVHQAFSKVVVRSSELKKDQVDAQVLQLA